MRFGAQGRHELDLSDMPPKEARRLDRVIAFALWRARGAGAFAARGPTTANRERIGVAVGSGIGGLQTLQEGILSLARSGPRRVMPFVIPMAICNMSSGYVAIRWGLLGPNLCHVSACATGAHSIGEAGRAIARGGADVMLAGGTEAPLIEVGVAGFASMRALSTRNDDPARASRPFDRDRDGFVIGEGASVLVLEAEEHAQARGARVLAELSGYAAPPTLRTSRATGTPRGRSAACATPWRTRG